ncbi:hypothetical protein [uncultured Chryseobacterium sp.]|uniref:hypothetical protein n=1 Tax=uncultured Chryseobacterium sp. TaxID=259322 RepID=UPI0025E86DBD|nr:hypothetical protein [uncultured Chryseobacterium sp.]
MAVGTAHFFSEPDTENPWKDLIFHHHSFVLLRHYVAISVPNITKPENVDENKW